MDPISRLCQLMKQDHAGYLKCEEPVMVAATKQVLVAKMESMESELGQLELRYKELIADRSSDGTERNKVYTAKTALAEGVENLKRIIGDPNAIIIESRRAYSQTQEAMDSRIEQRAIVDSLWGKRG